MYRRWCGLLLSAFLLAAHPTAALALSFQRISTISGVGDAGDYPSHTIQLVDLNHDPRLDFAAIDNNSSVLKLYFGDGTGQFNEAREVEVGDAPRAFASADLLGHSRTDFAVINDSTLTVLIQGDDPVSFSASVYEDFDDNDNRP